MGIGSILGKVSGFLGGLIPNVIDLGGLLRLLQKAIQVGVEEKDAVKLRRVSAMGIRLGGLMKGFGDEIIEAFEALGKAVDEDSEGGTSLTGNELLKIGDEVEDLGPAGSALVAETAELGNEIRKLF